MAMGSTGAISLEWIRRKIRLRVPISLLQSCMWEDGPMERPIFLLRIGCSRGVIFVRLVGFARDSITTNL